MGSGDTGWDARLTVTGQYYDGLSARRQEVVGHIVDAATGPSLVIEATDTGETIANWPGHDIQRLGGDGAPDALGCFGARFRLHWRDDDQRRDFLLRLTKRAQRRIFGLRVLHFLAILALVAPTLGVLWLGLNGLSVLYVRHIMTDQDWQDIGRNMIDLIETEIGFCDENGDGAAAMARLAGRFLDQLAEEAQIDAALARNRDRLRSNLRFRFLDHKLVNAFAVPGDVIVFSRGILAQSDDPDEIAVVLAHELGHHLAGHIAEKWRHSQTYGWVSLLIPGSAEQIQAVWQVSGLAWLLRNGRAAERDANRIAVSMANSADISSRGVVRFFSRIAEQHGKFPIFLSTHPNANETAEFFRRQGKSTASSISFSPEDWQSIKEVCQ